MNIKQFQEINKIDKTTEDIQYKRLVFEKMGMDYSSMTNEEADKIIEELFVAKEVGTDFILPLKLKIGKKKFMYETDLLKVTFGQWALFDSIINSIDGDDFTDVIHKLLGIFLRPQTFNIRKFRYEPEKFNGDKVDDNCDFICNNMEITTAMKLTVFFYLRGLDFMKSGERCYLELQMRETNQLIKSK